MFAFNDEFAKSAHLCSIAFALAHAFAHQMGVSSQGDLFTHVCVFFLCSTFSILKMRRGGWNGWEM